jgi:hypothetical protein
MESYPTVASSGMVSLIVWEVYPIAGISGIDIYASV